MTKLTKKQAFHTFKGVLKEEIKLGYWTYSKSDVTAVREAWNNYTDGLCKSGYISERQYDTWTNPF